MSKKTIKILLLTAAIIAVAILIYIISPDQSENGNGDAAAEATAQEVWTCSMHPQIRMPRPGLCPICNMDLIPLKPGEEADPDAPVLTISENAAALMDIEIMPVERKAVYKQLSVLGRVDYDQTKVTNITAWNPGRIEKLFADYVGMNVEKGDPLVKLYSPDLIVAQEEYLQAFKFHDKHNSESSKHTLTAAKEKLDLLGLTQIQITQLEKTGKAADNVTIYAPAGGTVIEKKAVEGMYVQTGTKLYTLADLSNVWVLLDIYESDLKWIRLGQKVEFTIAARQGRLFEGRISFIDPFLNTDTQTVRARLDVDNSDGLLKPGMFVKSRIHSPLDYASRVADDKDKALPLVIPSSAPLITGKRAIVYVRSSDSEQLRFEGREVVLGARAGDYYLVREGLDEGELVVVRGGFKIDSSLQISARPSMMSRDDELYEPIASDAVLSSDVKRAIAKIFDDYFVIKKALADDDFDLAVQTAKRAETNAELLDVDINYQEVLYQWETFFSKLKSSLTQAAKTEDIKSIRIKFEEISEAMEMVARYFGAVDGDIYVAHCPMAFDDKGANWLQQDEQILNPYFGDMMLRCGDIIKKIEPKPIWEGY